MKKDDVFDLLKAFSVALLIFSAFICTNTQMVRDILSLIGF